jgi:serine/threonine protein kinase
MSTDSDPKPIVPSGEILSGRYLVEKEIARGGMAHIVRAKDTHLNTTVVLKMLPSALSSQKQAIEEIKEEARIAMSLSHPNIVKLYQFESTPKYKFLVMEYVEGQSLGDRLYNKGRLPLEEIISYLSDACSALDYAHSHNVIHKDIKPDNFLISLDGTTKLADFGIAQKVKTAFAKVTQKSIMGTLLYMSPEHLMGRKIDYKSDIYSLGAVTYEMMSGFPPFYKGSIESQIALKKPDSIKGISENANRILMRALAKNPSSRWESATEFCRALTGETEVVDIPSRPAIPWPEQKPALAYPRTGQFRILAVDDEEDIRTTVSAIISGKGYEVDTAFDGEDALEKLTKKTYDLLITDIHMPRMDGIRLLSRIRNEGSQVPVIMLTALDMEKYVLKSYRSGADYYMSKPFAIQRLVTAVSYLLGDFDEEQRESLERQL